MNSEVPQLIANQILHVLLLSKNDGNYSEHMHAMYTLTTNIQCKRWDSILAAVSISNMYVVHNLNCLDTYTSCTVHVEDSVVVRHKRTNYMCYYSHAIQHIT